MFTGIVEETGIIKKKILNLDGMELTIHANKVLEDLKVNDSTVSYTHLTLPTIPLV